MEGGLQVLFLQFALPTIVLITHNRCTHKSSDHPQTDSQNITITPPSIPFGHPTLSKTTNIHDTHTKNVNTIQFLAKRNLVPARAGYNENKPLRNPHKNVNTTQLPAKRNLVPARAGYNRLTVFINNLSTIRFR